MLQQIQTVPAPLGIMAPGYDTILLSPDGLFAYVSLGNSDAIATYTRNAASGELTFLELVDDPVAGLDQPAAMALSPDGADLYVASVATDTLVHFRRDATTGHLTFANLVPTSDEAARIAISSDGRTVLVGSNVSYFSGNDTSAYTRNLASGALTQVFPFRPRMIAATTTADGSAWFIAAPVHGQCGVQSWPRDPVSGFFIGGEPSAEFFGVLGLNGGRQAQDVALTANEGQVIVAGEQSLQVMRRSPDFFPVEFFRAYDYQAQGVEGLWSTKDLAVSPDGSHVYVAGAGRGYPRPDAGALVSFRYMQDGKLGLVEQIFATQFDGLGAANSVAVSADSRFVYVAAREAEMLTVFEEQHACPVTPLTGCRTPSSAKIQMRDGRNGRTPKLRFSWKTDSIWQFNGDPSGGASYSLCVYENVAGAQTLVAALDAPQGAFDMARGWRRSGNLGLSTYYRYRDRFASPDGVSKANLTLKGLSYVAAGENAPIPSLPLSPPFSVQVVGSVPECWTSTFTADDIRPIPESRGTFAALMRIP